MVVRSRRQRAVRSGDRVRRRLARPLPGDQVGPQDHQHQSGAVVGDQRPVRRSASASTSRRSRRRSPAMSTTPAALAQAARRRRPAGRSRRAGPARSSPPRRARRQRQDQRRRQRVGLERRRPVQPRRRRRGSARTIARRSSTTSTATSTSDNPTLPALPPTLAPVVGALANARQRASSPTAASRLDIELPDTANLSYFSALNDRWDLMADVQWTGWSSSRRSRSCAPTAWCCRPALRTSRTRWRVSVGANYHYNDQWMFRGGLAYDQTPVNDADRTSAAARQRPRLARGRRAVQVEPRTGRSTSASPTSSATGPRSTRNATAPTSRAYGLRQRHLQCQRDDRLRPGDVLVLTARSATRPSPAGPARPGDGSRPRFFAAPPAHVALTVGLQRSTSHHVQPPVSSSARWPSSAPASWARRSPRTSPTPTCPSSCSTLPPRKATRTASSTRRSTA